MALPKSDYYKPPSLYDRSCHSVVSSYHELPSASLLELPAAIKFDIYYKMFLEEKMRLLMTELKDLNKFCSILRIKDKRLILHKCVQVLMDRGFNVLGALVATFTSVFPPIQKHNFQAYTFKGLELGDFLAEAGWFVLAEEVMTTCLQLIQRSSDDKSLVLALQCCSKILQVQNGNCAYSESNAMIECAREIWSEISENMKLKTSRATLFTEIAVLQFAESKYKDAFRNSRLALQEIDRVDVSPRVVVDVLRLCSKACVVKREFVGAGDLVRHALQIASHHFGEEHPKYADALLDYGFYLLNIDNISQALLVYKKALAIREAAFGGRNLYVAIAHEDIAYAYYVHEYNAGEFQQATDHAEKAIQILQSILPANHLLLASSRRVKALVLEEMAIDSPAPSKKEKLLKEALELHKASLALAQQAFGEMNVQTAKHYGNLGRLYQTLSQYEEAEAMHQRAIGIKEKLLGENDYEVALSAGHLASLYNYDMGLYTEAELLYERSIKISIKLFGEGYSGLEYDYRGLMRLYTETQNGTKYVEYQNRLLKWNQLRDTQEESEEDPLTCINMDGLPSIASFHEILEKYDTEPEPEHCDIDDDDGGSLDYCMAEPVDEDLLTLGGMETVETTQQSEQS